MTFPINQRLILEVSTIPIGATRIELSITPPSGDALTFGRYRMIITPARTCSAKWTPTVLGTHAFAWAAKDPGGLVVGEASGTFEVVAPAPVTMTAEVRAAT